MFKNLPGLAVVYPFRSELTDKLWRWCSVISLRDLRFGPNLPYISYISLFCPLTFLFLSENDYFFCQLREMQRLKDAILRRFHIYAVSG